MVTIAVDLMGGDNAPQAIGDGAIQASHELGVNIALVGTEEALGSRWGSSPTGGSAGSRMVPVSVTQVVHPTESAADAWRNKKDSSIAVGIRMVKEGHADAFVSAGNTGAIAASGLFSLRTMEGIERPAIATLYRKVDGGIAVFLDIGANVDCKPKFLSQFGEMGSAFMTKVFQVSNPRVGLLSNGEEEGKGTKLVKEAHRLLKQSDLNFIGNVEGFDILSGVGDVIVTDGFTGNVVLKLAEALAGSIFHSLKDALDANLLARASKPLWGPPIMSVAKQWDYSNIGGAPLLGVKGNIVMAHGRSDAADVASAIGLAQKMVREGWYRPDSGSVRSSALSE